MRIKSLIASGTALALMFSGTPVLAHDSFDQFTSVSLQPKLSINDDGKVSLRGTVAAVNASSLSVASWLGTWTVNVSSATDIDSRFNVTAALTDIKVGDTVEAKGTIRTDATLTMDAREIDDVSLAVRTMAFTGTIANLSGSTFTLVINDHHSVSATLASDAKIMVNGVVGSVANLSNGMKVLAKGAVNVASKTMVVTSVTSPATPKTLSGTITGLSGSNFTLALKNGSTMKVVLTDDVVLSLKGKVKAVTDLKNGLQITVSGALSVDGTTLTATKVHISADGKIKGSGKVKHKKDRR